MFVVWLFFVPAVPAEKKLSPPRQVDFSGYYSCVGVQNGKEYRAIVMVDRLAKDKDAHIIAWSMRGVSFTGIGFIKEGKFICGWSGSNMRGIGIYSFGTEGSKRDKTLSGEILALPGDGTTYRETWKFLRPLEKVDD